jgi:hypothetical protein
VKIYMVLIDDERFFFFADEAALAHDEEGNFPAPEQSGVRKWLHDRFEKFKAAWQGAGSGAVYWMRKAWDWLHTLSHPDERMLARVRSARSITLYHPASRSDIDVRSHWRNYLAREWRRHLFWLVINAMITPAAALLFILPGPNLIGIWFAYRSVHHLMVVWGLTRARRGLILTELHAIKALDLPIENDENGKSRHRAVEDSEEQLDRHVTWSRSSFPPVIRQQASQTSPPELARTPKGPEVLETGDDAPPQL